MLSSRAWQRYFGGDPAAIGRQLQLDGNSRTVVGVMPPGYRPLRVSADVFLAMSYDADAQAYEEMARYWLVGRLADARGAQAASAEATSVVGALAAERQACHRVGTKRVATEQGAYAVPDIHELSLGLSVILVEVFFMMSEV